MGGWPTAKEKGSEEVGQIHGGEIGRSDTQPPYTVCGQVDIRMNFNMILSSSTMKYVDADDCRIDQRHRQS
jgi:hypothetical protein